MHGDPSTAGGYSPHLQDSGNILPDQLHVVRFSGVGRCSLGVAYRARCPSRFACCVLARINALNSITPMPGCSCPACPVATYPMAIMGCELRELRALALRARAALLLRLTSSAPQLAICSSNHAIRYHSHHKCESRHTHTQLPCACQCGAAESGVGGGALRSSFCGIIQTRA